jgi:Zn-dependent M16 (insulinase) family peptidase
MERGRKGRYVESLERTLQSNHDFLKEAVEDFRRMCTKISLEKNIPYGIILDIRKAYKEIKNRLSEVNAIQQLLRGKYRQYYRRDPQRDKAFDEFGFIAKNSFSKFEYTLMQMEAQKRLGQKEEGRIKTLR